MGCRWKRIVKPVKNFEIFFISTSPGPQGPRRRVPQTSGNRLFFILSKSWHVGCPQKRLLKPVKNFEENLSFDLTQPPGTPPKGPPRSQQTNFFQMKQKVPCGVSPEASAQARQEF